MVSSVLPWYFWRMATISSNVLAGGRPFKDFDVDPMCCNSNIIGTLVRACWVISSPRNLVIADLPLCCLNCKSTLLEVLFTTSATCTCASGKKNF
jgi:hypothetical protein